MKRSVHTCIKEPDIEVIRTHVVYIKETIDEIKNKLDVQEHKYATKRELTVHRGLVAFMATALLSLYGYILGVIR